jgi:hypothetical protein
MLKHISVRFNGSSKLNQGLHKSAIYNATEVLGSPIPITVWLFSFVFLHSVVAESYGLSEENIAVILPH